MVRGMAVVQRLSEALANQIAAGEVVERPAAVVKELVENALDAGATRVEVRLEDGGRRLVEVVDDGRGMARDDALLALERHTTSKLRTSDDLFDIRTYGFRGEALPSIASVSRFTLTTRTADALAATRLVVEGGKVVSVEEAGAPQGTRIEVADLFWNVPARLAFLKTRATEVGHAVDWVSRLALVNPQVSFLVTEGRTTHLRAEATGDLKERIAAVLGRDLYEQLHEVSYAGDGLSLRGYAAAPTRAVSTTREIHTFVNGRYVRDKSLLHAVGRAYAGVLPVGQSPSVVLFLTVPPGQVDVNVHPQKLEVRFRDARAPGDAVVRAIAPMLAASPWIKQKPQGRTYVLGGAPAPVAQPVETPAPAPTPVIEPVPKAMDLPGLPAVSDLFDPRQQRIARALDAWNKGRPSAEMDVEPPPLVAKQRPEPVPSPPEPLPPARAPDEAIRFSDLRYLGQVHRTYLVCESPDGLVLLDQHAAHERVLYEKYKSERAGEAKAGQPLLVPVTLELSPADARLVEGALEALNDLGFEVEPFGGTTFSVKAAPGELGQGDLARTLRELAAEIRSFGHADSADRAEEALLARMACHAAVRAGHPLEPAEAVHLLGLLDGTPFHAQCPHGRPVVVRFDADDLAVRFRRDYAGTPQAAVKERQGRG
jgi:DNA mismatch repair protein MutL